MSHSNRVRLTLLLAIAVAIVVPAGTVYTQATAAQGPNDYPNPYQTIEGWAKMPEGRTWGSTSAVEIDRDGKSIWVGERCGSNSCANSNLPSILKFDSTGKLVKAFGEGMLIFPHGIFVDKDGNVWVTDGQGNRDPRRGGGAAAGGAAATAPPTDVPPKGHQVFKFSPDGKLLMTLGKAGGGDDSEFFRNPNDILVAPNGDIFVSEGHGGANGRILKFTKDGKFIKSFGKKGSAPGEFDQPHALAMDSKGRLFVGDRTNNRVQIFDQDGKFIAEWKQFGRPSGLYIDKNDVLYSADSESNDRGAYGNNPGWKRGIRIGSAKDGKVTAFIPDPSPGAGGTSAAEGVAVDSQGVVYGAEVGPRALKRYVKK